MPLGWSNLIVLRSSCVRFDSWADRFWDVGDLIVTEVKLCQIRQLPDRIWNFC
jgi:hypothetical protein